MSNSASRYQRQIIFPGVGADGQQKLLASKAVVVGCGALGSSIANLLARAGVGHLVITDRDFVELTNLQRQVLFEEEDVRRALPKAVAAAERLRRINSEIRIEGIVADVNNENIESLIAGADVVLDGTDNFETRYLINDACVKHGIRWVYGGGIAGHGMTLTIRPGESACLRCLYRKPPRPGSLPTCDTAGVVSPIIQVVAGWQVAEAMKLLTGKGKLNDGLMHFDVWENQMEQFKVQRHPDCPTCGQRQFDYLDARVGTVATSLCGRNAVQVRVQGHAPIALSALAQKLAPTVSNVVSNEYMLRFTAGDYELSVFPDARAIIKGTDDESVAKTLYARYIGS
ncbi:MAG: ThiF family adenylyltransferase [Chloroflexi bacterium]|nr:ThiF family adenylyltransferase [Chloroflexota bacterium]